MIKDDFDMVNIGKEVGDGGDIEEAKILSDVVLSEYSELRQDNRAAVQCQINIISLAATTLGVVAGIGLGFANSEDVRENVLVYSIFLTIIPAIDYILGILWVDQVYRQIRLAGYIALMETKINSLFSERYRKFMPLINWETWLVHSDQNCNSAFKVNFFYYGVCLGAFLVLPLYSVYLGWMLVKPDMNQPSFQYTHIILIAISLCFVLILIIYVIRIITYKKEIQGIKSIKIIVHQ